jgi:DNA-binding NarL/FixJ family response regulator
MGNTLILADDHAGFRAALRQYLTENSDFEVIAEVANGSELLSLKPDKKCDIILLDLWMPQMGGLETLAKIQDAHPGVLTIIVSALTEMVYRQKARDGGAAGFITKDKIHEQLIPCMAMVLAGQSYFPDAD